MPDERRDVPPNTGPLDSLVLGPHDPSTFTWPAEVVEMRRQAEADRDHAHVVDLAKEAGAYYRQLRAEGFKRHEAMTLVIEFQQRGWMVE